MPKPNYSFEKRQRELEKKRKKAEKADKKSYGAAPASDSAPEQGEANVAPAPATSQEPQDKP